MSKYFTDSINREDFVPSQYVAKVSARADANLARYYSLLRSTCIPGIENLISAIHGSTFSICHSHSHHHYTTGTLEHCLGVYDEMVKLSAGENVNPSDVILVALLHDVGKGRSRAFSAFNSSGTHHPERSMRIVRHYLGRNVSKEVLDAIRYHQHKPHNPKLVLQRLVHDADHNDASTCNDRFAFFRGL